MLNNTYDHRFDTLFAKLVAKWHRRHPRAAGVMPAAVRDELLEETEIILSGIRTRAFR